MGGWSSIRTWARNLSLRSKLVALKSRLAGSHRG